MHLSRSKERLLLIFLTFVVTAGSGLFVLWRWTDVFTSDIRVPRGIVVVNDDETSLQLRSGGYRIMLTVLPTDFTLAVFSDGECLPTMTLSGGEQKRDHHASFGWRQSDGRWITVSHPDWSGMPGVEHHWTDEALGFDARTFDLTTTKTERHRKAQAEPAPDLANGEGG